MRQIPPLNALKAFEAAARLGGVQRASEELYVTHGAISRQIKHLEEYLGITLFDRSLRTLSLTSAGEAYLTSISSALDLIHEGTLNLQRVKSSNTLGIATTHSIATKWLVNKLPEFTELHPDIEVWLSLGQSLTNFESANIDLALRMGMGPWKGVDCQPLKSDRLIVVCSPHIMKKEPLTQPKDLLTHTLLHDQDPSTQWSLLFAKYGLEEFDSTKGPRFSSSDVLIDAAMSGQGVALVNEALAKRDLVEKRLIKPLDLSIELGSYLWLIKSEVKPSNDNMMKFAAWIENCCKEL